LYHLLAGSSVFTHVSINYYSLPNGDSSRNTALTRSRQVTRISSCVHQRNRRVRPKLLNPQVQSSFLKLNCTTFLTGTNCLYVIYPETSFTLSEKFNEDTTFVYKGIDIVEMFHEYRSKDFDNFSFARDWIADFSSGSQFEQALPAHLTPALNLSELAIIDIFTRWPTLATVFDRVFASNSYDDVVSAIKNEDLADPVAFYLISIIVS